MGLVKDNVNYVRQRVAAACLRSGRDVNEVHIVAVTKTVAPEKILAALAAGITMIGENRIQEAEDKFPIIGRAANWHLVGHLQSNKINRCLEMFDVVQSLDSISLAQGVNDRAARMDRVVEVYLEVNTSGEASKFGVEPDGALALAKEMAVLPHIRLTGLMTVGAFLPDPEQVRPCFVQLRELRTWMLQNGLHVPHLSMGMTNDFEVAIEEGATVIRIGRALFGERTQTGEQP
jgi:pyridoxal phosphate enzyme (YggS family)